ncbi:ABC transporter permease [Streptomyces prunicolor]|uniref:ABC transporter permease n=1 Tax=Streptomyces prunicolor TaxID=67348 RepID=A0ABU4FFS9_9ACTN|nr:ABC transporter permease [Streptomyces prunicolor]MDV7219447.1 ABC transporter permease [Streptomyces prunicolor]
MTVESTAPAVTVAPARRRLRPRLGWNATLTTGVCILVAIVLLSLLIGLFGRYSTTDVGDSLLTGPSGSHWLGTDNLGRDLFTRTFGAARQSLMVAFGATTLAALIGIPIGLVAGYNARRLDAVLMAAMDTAMSIPSVLLALVLVSVFSPGMWVLIGGMGLIFVPYFARIVRAPALTVRERDFVSAARIAGVRTPVIIGRHVLPNVLSSALVQYANTAATCVLVEASLSYLGLGIQPPTPSWGRMIFEGQRYMKDDPLLVIVPGITLAIATAAFGLISDGLQEQLNPRGKRRTP